MKGVPIQQNVSKAINEDYPNYVLARQKSRAHELIYTSTIFHVSN